MFSSKNAPRLALTCLLMVCLVLLVACDIARTKSIEIPFNLDRNRVIVPTAVNGSKPLNLILDTGMRFDGVYLFHEEFIGQIDTAGAIEVKVPGAGAGEASSAVMIETGTLTFGSMSLDSQRVIISRSDYTQTFPTDGVIGWNLFGHYAVEINYDRQIITLHDSGSFQSDDSWTVVPLTMKEGMPFLECEVEVVEGETVPIIVYIDLASGDALELLTGPDQKFSMPENIEQKYLGTGLSGDVYGQVGVSRKLRIGPHELANVPTAFAPRAVRSKQEGADGILGDHFFRHFHVVFDYANERLCLKPNRSFARPFE